MSRGTQEWKQEILRFRLRDYHRLGSSFPACSANEAFCNSLNINVQFPSYNPKLPNRRKHRCLSLACQSALSPSIGKLGLGSSLFARRYLENCAELLTVRLVFFSSGY
jgi:hypothetical protein